MAGYLKQPTGGGVTDHGALTGLADDDHTQYLLADASRVVAGNLLPSADNTRALGASGTRWSACWATTVRSDTFQHATGNQTIYYADNNHYFAIGGVEKMRLNTSNLTLQVTAKWIAANEQTTVGAAGGASALPATPTKFLKVTDSAGTTLVVPAYAAS